MGGSNTSSNKVQNQDIFSKQHQEQISLPTSTTEVVSTTSRLAALEMVVPFTCLIFSRQAMLFRLRPLDKPRCSLSEKNEPFESSSSLNLDCDKNQCSSWDRSYSGKISSNFICSFSSLMVTKPLSNIKNIFKVVFLHIFIF